MRQIVLAAPGQFVPRDVALPSDAPETATVRVERIGVCGSDFHAFAGRHPAYVYPRVLGHELAGTVVQAGSNEYGIQTGDRCAIDPYINCGKCRTCMQGRSNCCENLEVLGIHRDGGMQELLNVPFRLLHSSKTLTLDELSIVETLGIGSHAVERSGAKEGESVLVIGAGPIGLGVAIFAKAIGCEVIVVEPNAFRLEFAKRQGLNAVSKADGMTAEIVFDATGNARVMSASLNRVAPGGRLVFVGLTSEPVSLNDGLFHKHEVTLIASRNSANQFPRIIRMLESNQISVREWITDRLAISEVALEFADLPNRPGLIKAVVSLENDAVERSE